MALLLVLGATAQTVTSASKGYTGVLTGTHTCGAGKYITQGGCSLDTASTTTSLVTSCPASSSTGACVATGAFFDQWLCTYTGTVAAFTVSVQCADVGFFPKQPTASAFASTTAATSPHQIVLCADPSDVAIGFGASIAGTTCRLTSVCGTLSLLSADAASNAVWCDTTPPTAGAASGTLSIGLCGAADGIITSYSVCANPLATIAVVSVTGTTATGATAACAAGAGLFGVSSAVPATGVLPVGQYLSTQALKTTGTTTAATTIDGSGGVSTLVVAFCATFVQKRVLYYSRSITNGAGVNSPTCPTGYNLINGGCNTPAATAPAASDPVVISCAGTVGGTACAATATVPTTWFCRTSKTVGTQVLTATAVCADTTIVPKAPTWISLVGTGAATATSQTVTCPTATDFVIGYSAFMTATIAGGAQSLTQLCTPDSTGAACATSITTLGTKVMATGIATAATTINAGAMCGTVVGTISAATVTQTNPIAALQAQTGKCTTGDAIAVSGTASTTFQQLQFGATGGVISAGEIAWSAATPAATAVVFCLTYTAPPPVASPAPIAAPVAVPTAAPVAAPVAASSGMIVAWCAVNCQGNGPPAQAQALKFVASANYTCGSTCTSSTRGRQSVIITGNTLTLTVSGTDAQLAAFSQAVQSGSLQSSGIPASATITYVSPSGVPAPSPPAIGPQPGPSAAAICGASGKANVTQACTATPASCPTTGATVGYCAQCLCGGSTATYRVVTLAVAGRARQTLGACDTQAALQAANPTLPSTTWITSSNGQTVTGCAGSSGSKKGLLGLLGLLGIIPLFLVLLLCCLLLIRRKKRGQPVRLDAPVVGLAPAVALHAAP